MAEVARKWRTSEDASRSNGLIGPNAILQMLPVIEQFGGAPRVAQMLARAGVGAVPDGRAMIPEGQAARLHRQLRREEPDRAAELSFAAGLGTADYILAHRIPGPAQQLLRALPAPWSARLLSRAIAHHAWTFAGSGRFRVISPRSFEIENNPLIMGEQSHHALCHWHVAVFERLYRRLVHANSRCLETQCAAQGGAVCRFELRTGDP